MTSMLDAGMTPEDILQELLGEFGMGDHRKDGDTFCM